MNLLFHALQLAGLTHFAILTASFMAPKALNWRENLAPLPRLLRQMFWVYGAFIVLMIVSFGTLTLWHTEQLASGDPLARAVCGMIALFWAVRLGVQLFVFDAKPFLTRPLYHVGYHLLTLAVIFLIAVYTWAAVFPKT